MIGLAIDFGCGSGLAIVGIIVFVRATIILRMQRELLAFLTPSDIGFEKEVPDRYPMGWG